MIVNMGYKFLLISVVRSTAGLNVEQGIHFSLSFIANFGKTIKTNFYEKSFFFKIHEKNIFENE